QDASQECESKPRVTHGHITERLYNSQDVAVIDTPEHGLREHHRQWARGMPGTDDGGPAGKRTDKGLREIHPDLGAEVQAGRGTRVELDHVKGPTRRLVDPIDTRETGEAGKLANLFQPRLDKRQIHPLADTRRGEIRRPGTSGVSTSPRQRPS